jgi:hypothetical protein
MAFDGTDNHPEVVAEAIRAATLVWLEDNRATIGEELGEDQG